MAIKEERIAAPERPGGQGLDANQEESGNRAITVLLTDPVRGSQTDLVITYRDGPAGQGAYEGWAARGMLRFQRFYDDGGGYAYRVIERIGKDPIANQDPTALGALGQGAEEGGEACGATPRSLEVRPLLSIPSISGRPRRSARVGATSTWAQTASVTPGLTPGPEKTSGARDCTTARAPRCPARRAQRPPVR